MGIYEDIETLIKQSDNRHVCRRVNKWLKSSSCLLVSNDELTEMVNEEKIHEFANEYETFHEEDDD